MWWYVELRADDKEVKLALIRFKLDHISMFAYAEIDKKAQPY